MEGSSTGMSHRKQCFFGSFWHICVPWEAPLLKLIFLFDNPCTIGGIQTQIAINFFSNFGLPGSCFCAVMLLKTTIPSLIVNVGWPWKRCNQGANFWKTTVAAEEARRGRRWGPGHKWASCSASNITSSGDFKEPRCRIFREETKWSNKSNSQHGSHRGSEGTTNHKHSPSPSCKWP